MAIEWYVRVGNAERGPISSEMLKQLAMKGKLGPQMQVKKGATGAWVTANRIKGLFPNAAGGQPSESAPVAAPAERTQAVSKPRADAVASPSPRAATRTPAAATLAASAAASDEPAAATAPQREPSETPIERPRPAEQQAAAKPKRRLLGNFWVQMAVLALGLVGVFGVFLIGVITAGKITRPSDELIGKWEAGDTQDRVEFSTDGRAIFTKGGAEMFLRWQRLGDGRLRVEGRSAGAVSGEVYQVVTNGDSLTLKKPTGSEETYQKVTSRKK